MRFNLKIISGLILSITLLAAFVLLSSNFHSAQAALGDNVHGAAWGASDGQGIGWVSMNSCDPAFSPTCLATNYGVSIDPATGDFSGAGWSAAYGWINFDPPAGTCPGAGAFVDLNDLVVNGQAYVQGWIHVYNATNDGFWDGCISMSMLNETNPPYTYGVTLYDNGDIDGAAWGAEVVGWLDFDQVYSDILVGCMDSSADSGYNPNANVDDPSQCVYNNQPPYCANPPWSSIITTQGEWQTYNDTAALNGDAPLLPPDNNDYCVLKDDLCTNILDYLGTTSDIDDYFDPTPWYTINNQGYPECYQRQPGCNTDPNFDSNTQYHDPNTCGGPQTINEATIPGFEEI